MTECTKCGDVSNSAPELPCGRVEYDDNGVAITEPCTGMYVNIKKASSNG